MLPFPVSRPSVLRLESGPPDRAFIGPPLTLELANSAVKGTKALPLPPRAWVGPVPGFAPKVEA